jgi:hypothetical protein
VIVASTFTSDGDWPPLALDFPSLALVTGELLSIRKGQGPVGRISIDLRIKSSKLSLLLFTSSIGGNMCKDGPAAIVKGN